MDGVKMMHVVHSWRTPTHYRPTPWWWRWNIRAREMRHMRASIHRNRRSTGRWTSTATHHVPSTEIVWLSWMHPAPSHRPSNWRGTTPRRTMRGGRATPGWTSSHHGARWWPPSLMERRPRPPYMKSSWWRSSAHFAIGWWPPWSATPSRSKSRIMGPTSRRPIHIPREAPFHLWISASFEWSE